MFHKQEFCQDHLPCSKLLTSLVLYHISLLYVANCTPGVWCASFLPFTFCCTYCHLLLAWLLASLALAIDTLDKTTCQILVNRGLVWIFLGLFVSWMANVCTCMLGLIPERVVEITYWRSVFY